MPNSNTDSHVLFDYYRVPDGNACVKNSSLGIPKRPLIQNRDLGVRIDSRAFPVRQFLADDSDYQPV